MNRKKLILITLAMFLALSVSAMVLPQMSDKTTVEAFSKQTLRVGSSGNDVRELQGRLKYLGFYTGKIDGEFSWRTYWATRNFQYKFGLKVDGVVAGKTKLKLWKATQKWRPGAESAKSPAKAPAKAVSQGPAKGIPNNFSSRDIKLIANAVYGESRGEPYIGQVAVAAVILNRVGHSSFPNTPAGVIFEPRAFTAVADGQIWLTPNQSAKKAVMDAINGMDPTGGAIYYFNPDTATSPWIWSRPQIKRIGKHIFCR